MSDAEKDIVERRVANLIDGLRRSTKEGEHDADALEVIMSDRDTLRAKVERLTKGLDYEVREHSSTMDRRDEAEEVVGSMYQAVTGNIAEWSNIFHFHNAFWQVETTIDSLRADRDAALARAEKAEAALNTPEILDFTKAVVSEAAHQRARWPSEHDAGKTDADWYWLIGYLAGKALHNPANEMPADEARLHRIVTVAAAAANWHLAALGKTNMRPGTDLSAPHSLAEGE